MSKIVEIYPDAEEVKTQVEVRKKFGWASKVSINDRGVYEVTFTRDDSKAKNKKLKKLEDDFMQCSVASDYIERYNGVYADKKKFKAFSPIVLIILIYCLIQVGVLAFVAFLFKGLYAMDPNSFYNLGVNVTVGEASTPLTPDWQQTINLEELGLYGLLSTFGVKEKILTLTVDVIMNFLFVVGIGAAVLFVLILFFMIRKAAIAKTFYKAEVEYIQRRKDLLNAKTDELEDRMDEIMDEVERVTA